MAYFFKYKLLVIFSKRWFIAFDIVLNLKKMYFTCHYCQRGKWHKFAQNWLNLISYFAVQLTPSRPPRPLSNRFSKTGEQFHSRPNSGSFTPPKHLNSVGQDKRSSGISMVSSGGSLENVFTSETGECRVQLNLPAVFTTQAKLLLIHRTSNFKELVAQ